MLLVIHAMATVYGYSAHECPTEELGWSLRISNSFISQLEHGTLSLVKGTTWREAFIHAHVQTWVPFNQEDEKPSTRWGNIQRPYFTHSLTNQCFVGKSFRPTLDKCLDHHVHGFWSQHWHRQVKADSHLVFSRNGTHGEAVVSTPSQVQRGLLHKVYVQISWGVMLIAVWSEVHSASVSIEIEVSSFRHMQNFCVEFACSSWFPSTTQDIILTVTVDSWSSTSTWMTWTWCDCVKGSTEELRDVYTPPEDEFT